jgi:hypothetical protein
VKRQRHRDRVANVNSRLTREMADEDMEAAGVEPEGPALTVGEFGSILKLTPAEGWTRNGEPLEVADE